MKIVMLGEDKIKVELDIGDLTKMNITTDSLSYKSPEIESMLSKIIMAVVRETGIFIENGKVLVELNEKKGANVTLVADSVVRREKNSVRHEKLIFEIPCLEDVFMLLSVIDERILRKMTLYKMRSGFYIVLPRFPLPVEMWEFSKKCKRSRLLEAMLTEHGRLIARGEGIVKIAEEIKR